jgi:hypothetical protein
MLRLVRNSIHSIVKIICIICIKVSKVMGNSNLKRPVYPMPEDVETALEEFYYIL